MFVYPFQLLKIVGICCLQKPRMLQEFTRLDEYLMCSSINNPMRIKQQQIDTLDKKLLNKIQWTFPLVQRPFLKIGYHNIVTD